MDSEFPPRVLIVESDPATVSLLLDLAQSQGYRTWSVADGEAALEQLRVVQPHVVLLALDLKGMDGALLLVWLQAQPGAWQVPVIVMASDTAIPTQVEQSATAIVPKPFEQSTLLVIIEQIITNLSLQARVVGG